MEFNPHLALTYLDLCRHVHQVLEDAAGMRLRIPAHPPSQEPVKPAGDHQQGHIKINLEANGGTERVQMEKAHRVAQAVLNEHAVGITGEQGLHRSVVLIGQENRRLVMPEVQGKDLSEKMILQLDLLFVDARRAELAGGHFQFHLPPSRAGQSVNFLEQRGVAPPQGNKVSGLAN